MHILADLCAFRRLPLDGRSRREPRAGGVCATFVAIRGVILQGTDYRQRQTWRAPTRRRAGRALQQAMVEGNSHIHERTSWHIDDDTRRTVRKAWESLGREPESWMRGGGPQRQPGPIRHRDWPGRSDDAGGPAAGARGPGCGQSTKGDEGHDRKALPAETERVSDNGRGLQGRIERRSVAHYTIVLH